MSVASEILGRGLVANLSHEEEFLAWAGANQGTVYCGVDPTAPSLHLGNLVPLLGLRRFQELGFTPIVLFGGATGLVGDPTGRNEMREMRSPEEIAQFIKNFKRLAARWFLEDVPNGAVFVNNLDWMGGMGFLEFGREVGRHFTVARLLASEVNRTRFDSGGLTFLELGYQLLQAYDFLHLRRTRGCVLQLGGSDQWANILAGADLIRRMDGGQAFALTFPLLVGKDGRKLGKTAGNALWLDASLTSAYEFYQYLRDLGDDDVLLAGRLLLPGTRERFDQWAQGIPRDVNAAKASLAYEVTAFVHGAEAAASAQLASQALFLGGGSLEGAPTTVVSAHEAGEGLGITELLVRTGLAMSKTEARKLIQGRGVRVFDLVVEDPVRRLTGADFRDGVVLLRKGKKDFRVIRLQGGVP